MGRSSWVFFLDAVIPKSRNVLSHWLPGALRRHPGERRLPWPIPCSCLEGSVAPAPLFPPSPRASCIPGASPELPLLPRTSFIHPPTILRASCIASASCFPQCSCRYFLIEIICKTLDEVSEWTQLFLLPIPWFTELKCYQGECSLSLFFFKLRTQKKRCELCKIPFASEQKGSFKLPPNLFLVFVSEVIWGFWASKRELCIFLIVKMRKMKVFYIL